jgi:hypothetical protein
LSESKRSHTATLIPFSDLCQGPTKVYKTLLHQKGSPFAG